MPGLCRVSTLFFAAKQGVDGRDKPGHDAVSGCCYAVFRFAPGGLNFGITSVANSSSEASALSCP